MDAGRVLSAEEKRSAVRLIIAEALLAQHMHSSGRSIRPVAKPDSNALAERIAGIFES